MFVNKYCSSLCPRTPWSQPSGDRVERLRPSSWSEVFSSNTVTWLPTRMPSSHLDTEMAFLSDKSIVYTLTLGAALTTKSAVPLPKGGAPLTCGATSTTNPYPAFPKLTSHYPICPPSQTHPLIGFLLVSLLVAACPFYSLLPMLFSLADIMQFCRAY